MAMAPIVFNDMTTSRYRVRDPIHPRNHCGKLRFVRDYFAA
jgi:hypothetical protein